jgi:hypothetical protein
MKRIAISVLFPICLAACAALVPAPRTPSPAQTPSLPLVLRGSGDEPAPVQQAIQLAASNYVVQWEAQQPLQPGWETCDVALDLFDSDGESAMEGGISELLDRPSAGHAQLPALPAGHYTLWTSFSCPFRVSLTPY